jgi:hypothetical protein
LFFEQHLTSQEQNILQQEYEEKSREESRMRTLVLMEEARRDEEDPGWRLREHTHGIAAIVLRMEQDALDEGEDGFK